MSDVRIFQQNSQWLAFFTIVRKELVRQRRIWSQAFVPPVISMSLYFLIFGHFIGGRIGMMGGVPYIHYIIPGLIMMSVIQNAYANSSSSFFTAKFQRSIEEMLVAPIRAEVMVAGYVVGGLCRGLIVGSLVMMVAELFTHAPIPHVTVLMIVSFLAAALFSLAGMLNGLLAKKFDDISLIPTFVLAPLTYLGGVFYSINVLPAPWKAVSLFNPVLYMVNAFRYGLLGIADVDVWLGIAILGVLVVVLWCVLVILVRRGVGLKT